MNKKVSIVFVLLFGICHLSAQVSTLQTPEVGNLEDLIIKKIKRSKCSMAEQPQLDLNFVHLFHVNYSGTYSKEDFHSGQFMENIAYRYLSKSKKNKSLPIGRTIIYDSQKTLQGLFYQNTIFCAESYTSRMFVDEKQILPLLESVESPYLITMNVGTSGTYFVIDSKKTIQVLHSYNNVLELMQLQDFIEMYWNRFKNEDPKYHISDTIETE